jgi:hypothetical protein
LEWVIRKCGEHFTEWLNKVLHVPLRCRDRRGSHDFLHPLYLPVRRLSATHHMRVLTGLSSSLVSGDFACFWHVCGNCQVINPMPSAMRCWLAL